MASQFGRDRVNFWGFGGQSTWAGKSGSFTGPRTVFNFRGVYDGDVCLGDSLDDWGLMGYDV